MLVSIGIYFALASCPNVDSGKTSFFANNVWPLNSKIAWQSLVSQVLDLKCTVIIDGKPREATIDSGAIKSICHPDFVAARELRTGSQITFPGGAVGRAAFQESKDLPSYYNLLIGIEAISSLVLVIDHDKRFAVIDRRQWDDNKNSLVGSNPTEVDAHRDSDGHLLIPTTIDNEIVDAIVDTGTTNIGISEGFAERHKIRPDRMLEMYIATGATLSGYVNSLTFRLGRDSLLNAGPASVFPDTALGQPLPAPIVGTSAFKNYMVVIDFAKNKVWLSR